MCGGGKPHDDVDLPIRQPTAASGSVARPQSSAGRPGTSKRTHTSSGDRPRPDRPPSKRESRAGSSSRAGRSLESGSSTRPRTSDHGSGSKRSSSRAGSSARPRTTDHGSGSGRSSSHREHRSRREFPATIQEYPEDRAIRRGLTEMGTFIDQHVINYYPLSIKANTGRDDMDNPKTRHLAIRRYIARTVIESIVTANIETSPSEIAHEIAGDLQEYSNSNGERIENLLGLCELGERLRSDIERHPAEWQFGSFEEGHSNKFVVLIPSLSRDGQQIIPSQRFRVD